jgi:hypothetical protein
VGVRRGKAASHHVLSKIDSKLQYHALPDSGSHGTKTFRCDLIWGNDHTWYDFFQDHVVSDIPEITLINVAKVVQQPASTPSNGVNVLVPSGFEPSQKEPGVPDQDLVNLVLETLDNLYMEKDLPPTAPNGTCWVRYMCGLYTSD